MSQEIPTAIAEQIEARIKEKYKAETPTINLIRNDMVFGYGLAAKEITELKGHKEIMQNMIDEQAGNNISLGNQVQELQAKVQFAANKMYEANSEIDKLKAEIERLKAPKWVSVEDELPMTGELVMFLVNTYSIYLGMLHHGKFKIWGLGRPEPITDMKVTHWQLLPLTPQQIIDRETIRP